ncbi:MAG: ABC transporter substrate-binding protein [Alphaproteobacteria bacterium]|nr:ABC transporter substrate-binding protein [Alphaproteobacteria bacterium]
MTPWGLRRLIALLVLTFVVLVRPGGAAAETDTIRIAQQFGISYLPLIVMKERGLVEEAAVARGLPRPHVDWAVFSGAAAMNDALISGTLDFATAGVGPMITIWDKTRQNLRVHGVAALGSMPNYLTTNNPAIKTLRDVTEHDRIALPAARVGFQAVVLQMAAAREFGIEQYARLDPLTVSMSHPDAAAALLTGRTEITIHFTSPPFQNQELLDPRIHRILSSYDVLGGPHTFNVVYATGRFRDANPVTMTAFVAALDQAMRFINDDPAGAARLYIEAEKSKLPPDLVESLIRADDTRFTIEPQATMKFADFMARTGSIKAAPSSWQDLFFPEIHGRKGS